MSARTDLANVPGFKTGRAAFAWRGIGQVRDLDIDFASRDRPALVTRVLASCAEPPVEEDGLEAIWRLSLAARVGGLLAVHAATTGADELPLAVHCPHEDCGEGMEVALPVAALLALAQEAEGASETEVEAAGSGAALQLRRPCGTDQRIWRQAAYDDAEAAQAAVLDSLVVGGSVAPEDRAAVAEAMVAFDPLSCFELDVTCPECARQADIPVDMEAVLLASLARSQGQTIADVDRLARRYGWSEAEVLAVPAWRRRRYLALDGDGWPS